ncbi:MAG: type VI secretion system tube protein TssD [Candidatus Thorarchaeota archaeon]
MNSDVLRKYLPVLAVIIGFIASTVVASWTESQSTTRNTSDAGLTTEDPSVRILMIIRGEVQGIIKGSGRDGYIECRSFKHSLITPRDDATGDIIGDRQHRPIRITKVVDQSTPLLMHAFITSENLVNMSLDFYRASLSSEDPGERYYTIRLENAYIGGIQQLSEDAEMGGEQTGGEGPIEEITFVYRKITWIYLLEGLSTNDTWNDDT